MELPRPEAAFLGVGTFNWVENRAVEFHVVAIPIRFTLGDANRLMRLPLGQGEVAVTHQVAGTCPGAPALVHSTELLYGRAVDGEPCGVTDHSQQVGDRTFQSE